VEIGDDGLEGVGFGEVGSSESGKMGFEGLESVVSGSGNMRGCIGEGVFCCMRLYPMVCSSNMMSRLMCSFL
jgi:hypothetical protein